MLSEASVLIVDDEAMLLELYGKWLRHEGFRKVLTAADGAAALALMETEPIDLLLTDVRMPVMDGITLVRRLGTMGKTLPSIIFVSGFSDVDQREMYGLGVEAFVSKPFDRAELLVLLERAIANRSSLWGTAMAVAPLQTVSIEAERFDRTAGTETIGLGRGGFSVLCAEPLSPGKVAFDLKLGAGEEIAGEGYVRWYSRADGKAGIEVSYLAPGCLGVVAEAVEEAAPRSFIPGA